MNEPKDGGPDLPKVILTEAQWAILQLFEADRTRAALEVAETQKQLLAQAAITLSLQAELMAQQESRHMSEKRDWFAGQALAGISAHQIGAIRANGETKAQADARWSYAQADAMLAAREAQP